MKPCLLEINDAGIRLSDAGGLLRVSPGFAFLHHGELLTGEQAAARIRTNPRAGSDQFWHQLSQTPLPRPLGPARTHADLAWYHLRQLWTPLAADHDQVLLTVSGDVDAKRLSTLLGIARACDMPVRGVVAAAVAAAASHAQYHAVADAAELTCIDVQWHRLLLEPLLLQAGRVSLAAHDSAQHSELVRHGVAALFDRWAHMIAEAFLQRTRFDPLHTAASEQQLYDALPGWLQQLSAQPQIELKLSAGGHDFVIELGRQPFSKAAADLYAPLLSMVAQQKSLLLLRQRLSLLPGLVEQLRERADVTTVADDTVSAYLLQMLPDLISAEGDEVPHYLSLPLAAAASELASASNHAAAPPTHLSDGVSLWSIDAEGMMLPPSSPDQQVSAASWRLQRSSDGQISLTLAGQASAAAAVDAAAAVLVNDEALSPEAAKHPRPLAAGDRLQVAGQQFVLLRLV